jgi:hypothetical protein
VFVNHFSEFLVRQLRNFFTFNPLEVSLGRRCFLLWILHVDVPFNHICPKIKVLPEINILVRHFPVLNNFQLVLKLSDLVELICKPFQSYCVLLEPICRRLAVNQDPGYLRLRQLNLVHKCEERFCPFLHFVKRLHSLDVLAKLFHCFVGLGLFVDQDDKVILQDVHCVNRLRDMGLDRRWVQSGCLLLEALFHYGLQVGTLSAREHFQLWRTIKNSYGEVAYLNRSFFFRLKLR